MGNESTGLDRATEGTALFDNATKASVTERVYTQLKTTLGGQDQLFTMEYPGRLLDFSTFEYHSKQRYSILTKPYPVAEAEFRLSNQLLNPAPITHGPNGQHLSTVFDTLINNYVPQLKQLKDFFVDKFRLREWLLTEIEEEFKGRRVRASRMAFCQMLYEEYLQQKVNWLQEKNAEFDRRAATTVRNSRGEEVPDYEGYSRWVTSVGMIRDEKLNGLFHDAVVRGNYHEVLTFLGFLNASSVPEQLELTKSRMRASSRQSLDASETIYPVQMQPASWYQFLRPNLSPRDLLASKDVLLQAFSAKQARLEHVESRLASLTNQHVAPETIAELEGSIKAAKEAWATTEKGLVKEHGKAVLSAFEIYMNAQTGGVLSKAFSKNGKSLLKWDSDMASSLSKLLEKGVFDNLTAAYERQYDLLSKQEELATLQMRKSRMMSNDFRSELEALKRQQLSLTREIDYLKPLLGGVLYLSNNPDEAPTRVPGKIPTKPSLSDADNAVILTALKLNPSITAVHTADSSAIDKLWTSLENAVKDKSPQASVAIYIIAELYRWKDQYDKDDTSKELALAELKRLLGAIDFKTGIGAITTETHKKDTAQETFEAAIKDGAADDSAARQRKTLLELRCLVQASTSSGAADLLPEQDLEEADAFFSDIILQTEMTRSKSGKFSMSSSSETKAAFSLFFASFGGSASTRKSKVEDKDEDFKRKCQIGFRAAKVTFDRGGWFNPTLFALTKSFYYLYPFASSGGNSPLQIEQAHNHADKDARTLAIDRLTRCIEWDNGEEKSSRRALLPCFPVAFVIAKDITIKFECSAEEHESLNAAFEEEIASSGSCFIFSCSRASATQSTSATAFSSYDGQSFIIRIPGPQIIGWFQEMVQKDESTSYSDLRTEGADALTIQDDLDRELQRYRTARESAMTDAWPSAEPTNADDADGDW